MLNKGSESENLCLISNLKRNVFGNSPLSMMLSVGLPSFIMLSYVPFMLTFLRVFKCVLHTIKSFPATIELMIQSLFFNWLMWYIIFIDLVDIKRSLHPWGKPLLIFLIYCWIQIASILFQTFVFMFISDTALTFYICKHIWFWYQGDGALTVWIWQVSFLRNSLEEFLKDKC